MNNTLAVTISPKDRVGEYYAKRYANPLRMIYDDDVNLIRRALNRSSNDYVIYPELDATGRLHYHGTVKVNNMVNWKSTTCGRLKTLGFIKVKVNPNSGWDKYCTKEWDQTQKILDICVPITYAKLKSGPKVREIEKGAKHKLIVDYL